MLTRKEKEAVFVLNRVKGAERQRLGPLRACAQFTRPQAMGSLARAALWERWGHEL